MTLQMWRMSKGRVWNTADEILMSDFEEFTQGPMHTVSILNHGQEQCLSDV